MIRRIQNKVAESRYTLPVTVLYGCAVWATAGLFSRQWWIQFCCFIASAYLMMELNNRNMLIRIFSRTVSCSYIVLTCIAISFFLSISGAVTQLAVIASLLLLFQSYQDKEAAGHIFYAFLCLGLGCMADIRLICYLPLYWGLTAWTLYSLSWRTGAASLLGLLTPYWFSLAWHMYQGKGDISQWLSFFSGFHDIVWPPDYTVIGQSELVLILFLVTLALLGAVHFVLTSYHDKIRVRQIYYSFILTVVWSLFITAMQPQCFDVTCRMMIISVSPLIAHFIALTHTRLSNIVFFALLAASLILTCYFLWISSSVS